MLEGQYIFTIRQCPVGVCRNLQTIIQFTRSSGEVVWRCANRVEHGKGICHSFLTLPEQKVIELL